MKKTKIASRGHHKQRTQAALKAHHKHLIRKRRPIHKRILLHPVSAFIMLCVGVFLVGWTFQVLADSFNVFATVLAPLPTSSAPITWPADQTHFTTTPITILGTCPSNTYVQLYRNGNFSGTANCGPSITGYQIQTDLSAGANTLYTRVFNITNNEGPQSPVITIWYDQTQPNPPPIPTTVPTTINILSIDSKPFHTGTTIYASLYPTIRGTVIPFSYIIVTFHSSPLTCATYADTYGNWSCTLETPLPNVLHTIEVVAKTPSGAILTIPTFTIINTAAVAALQASNRPVSTFQINHTPKYQVYASGKSYSWTLSLSGGIAPYAITVAWDDGSSTTIVRSNTDSFQITHVYRLVNVLSDNYNIRIRAVDSVGSVANLQLAALVTFNGAQPSKTTATTAKPSFITSSVKFATQWVWLVWPFYIIVLLMTISFWLGEKEEYIKLVQSIKRKRRRKVSSSN